MAVYIWLYRSHEARPMTSGDLDDILDVARRFNGERGITGMLLYHNGRFTQVVEGEESDIRELKESICGDARHREVTTLFEGWAEERTFAQWSMAFHQPDAAQQADLDSQLPLAWAHKTLESFADASGVRAVFAQMARWTSSSCA